MRAINLIPPEQRRGERAPLRSGPLAYVLVAVLAVALGAVTLMVLTDNQIAEKQSEKASLEAERAEAEARAAALGRFAQFATLQETRQQTVTSLAQSRFDWERVLRELAIVIPDDVWVVEIGGSVSPEISVGSDMSLRSNVAGPALSLVGCGAGQDAVARFVAALEDIDGVTRVGMQSSQRPEGPEAAEAPTEEMGDECRVRDYVAKFEIIAAFDAVEAPPSATTPPAAGTPAAPAAPTSAETTTPAAETTTPATTEVAP
jgi:Tfp pilus assembly protein PilN